MKRFLLFLIIPLIFVITIGVFAISSTNNLTEIERPFDPDHPEAGRYRVAADAIPKNQPSIATNCYTHSKAIATDDVKFPTVRIQYYAYAQVSSLKASNRGHCYIDVEVPRKAETEDDKPYQGEYFYYLMKHSEADIRRGSPDIDACSAESQIKDQLDNESNSKIPFPEKDEE